MSENVDPVRPAPPRDYRGLELFEDFPGFHNAGRFLEDWIKAHGPTSVGDIGGGANPMLGEDFIQRSGVHYSVMDISAGELAKAPESYNKICIDICAPPDEFDRAVPPNSLDLIFSHMFLEHIADPAPAHRNIRRALKPGGVAIHFYPSPNNIPLTMNRLLPGSVSGALLRLVQPQRTQDGSHAKFPAYYRLCGMSTRALKPVYADLGFEIVAHSRFVGHDYYKRIPVVRTLERAARRPLRALGIPITSAELLILQ